LNNLGKIKPCSSIMKIILAISLIVLFGNGKNYFEVGAGFTFRANITPLFNTHGFWPLFAGIGLGYAF